MMMLLQKMTIVMIHLAEGGNFPSFKIAHTDNWKHFTSLSSFLELIFPLSLTGWLFFSFLVSPHARK
uniref:Putative secreted protein n=1 Tax=Psorophora albipes TaxID=869069 RepID=T1D5Z5_9DIPT